MSESQEILREIAYLSKLISTHKNRSLTYSKHSTFNVHRRIENLPASPKKPTNKRPYTSKKWSGNQHGNKFKRQTTNPTSKYKWKPESGADNSSALPSQHNSVPYTLPQPIAGKSKEKLNSLTPEKQIASCSTQPVVKKQTKSNSNDSIYSWSKDKIATSVKSTPGKSKRQKTMSTSKMVWKRRSSATNVPQKTPTKANVTILMGKRIASKYKLINPQQKSRNSVKENISRNPYKVVKKSPSNFNANQQRKKRSRSFAHINNKKQHSFYGQNRKQRFVNSHSKRSTKYKLIRTRQKIHSVQTRDRRSGNIILKRKLSQSGCDKASSVVRGYPSVTRKLASQVLQRSLLTIRSRNEHKLKKVFCLFFNRFGRCNRGEKCPYTHDPERVAVCTRFLRGTCRDKGCLFSHKISKKKIPVCSFYLAGKCSIKDCSYLHVFVGHNAGVCPNFATAGYCQMAENCKQLHIRACPEFYAKGTCSKKEKCKLPHKSKRSAQPISKDAGKSLILKSSEPEVTPVAFKSGEKAVHVLPKLRTRPRLGHLKKSV